MTPRPMLFVCAPGGDLDLPARVGDLEVAPVPGDPAAVIDDVRRSGASRWLLAGYGGGLAVVTEVAARVMAGGLPVFGLAGVVAVAGPAPAELDVPLLLTSSDSAAEDIAGFWSGYAGRGPLVPTDYAAVLASDRVSSRTRAIHARRALADDPDYAPAALDAAQLDTLRAVADRLVPQDGPPERWIDLAARVDARLARGEGDGWRFVDQPPDVAAYRAALAGLAGAADLAADLADEHLARWVEDACVDMVQQWLAHPAHLARIGFDGLASGGDDALVGFELLGAGEREAWEPAMEAPR